MDVNQLSKLRLAIYILTGVGSLVVAYLSNTGTLGRNEVELWIQLSAFVNGLSAANVDTNKKLSSGV